MTKRSEQWAIVTGASARGGLAITRELHNRGLSVVVHHAIDASAARAKSVVEELNSIRPASAIRWQAALQDHPAFPHDDLEIGVVICNASRLVTTQCADFEKGMLDFRIHVSGHASLLASVEQSLKRNNGSVVAISDIQTTQPNQSHVWYHVAKGALETLIRTLAIEWAPHVRCNAVAPGAMEWQSGWNDEEWQQAILSSVPLHRTANFEEFASTVAWLALENTYITGQVIKFDGGRSIWLR